MNPFKSFLLLLSLFYNSFYSSAQNSALVDYDSFEDLVSEVKAHRSKRLVHIDEFNQLHHAGAVILDTRSKAMYDAKHVKGAIHLNFSDFTQDNLDRLFSSNDVSILIYCNNNMADDQVNFTSKIAVPGSFDVDKDPLTLALNIPTYINLYGYGYRNVYELTDLISVFDTRIEFEGTNAPSSN